MKQLKKTILTLVALLAVTTGAWAQTETLLTTITATAKEQASYSTANMATVSFSYTANGASDYFANWGWYGYGWIATVNAAEGYTITKCVFYDDANRTATDSEAPFVVETTEADKTPKVNGTPILANTSKGIKKIEVYGYVTPTTVDAAVQVRELTRNAEGNWVLDAMPDYNGVLEVTFNERFKLDSIPLTWTITVNGADSTEAVTRYSAEEGDTTMGWLMVMEGADVRLVPPVPVKPTVKSVTLEEVSDAPFASVTTEDIGKIIGADGNIYDDAAAATAAGTTASAIIAYVGTAGSVDESSATYKGLAIALTDATSGDPCKWYTDNSGTCVSQTDAVATAITYKNGIASTNTLTGDGHTHAAATAASSYGTARPSGVSDWFLPSMGQWNLIVQGLATKQAGSTVSTNLTTSSNDTYKATNLNTVIAAAGGTILMPFFYWSSTEYNTGYAWLMLFNTGNANSSGKSTNYFVRAVFAF